MWEHVQSELVKVSKARFRGRTVHKPNLIRPKLFRPAELIQMLILIPAELKMLISVKLLSKYVIIIYALHEKFGVWIKAVPK